MAHFQSAVEILDSLIKSLDNPMKRIPIVDCHAHLTSYEFAEDLGTVLNNAMKMGIDQIICVAETYADCMALLALKHKYPDLIGICCGQHPEKANIETLPEILNFIDDHHDELVGIGECGLDFSPHVLKTQMNQKQEEDEEIIKKEQKLVLKQQIEKAIEYNLPLNVHSRSAGHHAITFLSENGARNVLFHAFDGRASYAKRACAEHENYLFSIPPSVHRSPQKQKLIRSISMEHIVLETDSPALGPIKGVRNEPMNISHSIKYIASIKGMPEDQVRNMTTRNALRIFQRLKLSK